MRSASAPGRQRRAMKFFPVFFNLKDRSVLVVGAGEVALRKIELLQRAGANVTVVAPQSHVEVSALAAAKSINFHLREFLPEDLTGANLVIVATSHRAINRWIANLCESKAIPVNVVDDLEASRFIVPAIIDRDPVLVAVSTAGASPVLARRVRERLEALLPKRIGAAAVWLRSLRKAAQATLRDATARRRFFEELVDGKAMRRFMDGDEKGARQIAQQLLQSSSRSPRAAGEVTLVGAGPGDAELLTIKALRALQDADVILYDRLVSAEVLDLARRDARRLCVGKAAGQVGSTQDEINALLIDLARQGLKVVRLKGGDPFIFGRGGEELQALADAQIDFAVIPGITAAVGAAAYAGIPLTHRDYAHSVTFVTGHADKDGKEPDWRALAASNSTVVFYMGLARLEYIVAKLIEHGAKANLPAGLIAQATRADQRVISATLSTVGAAALQANLTSPVLLIVGEVVALQGSLAWFGAEASLEASKSA
jgi:uroporphyrin-III C-methyltransferase / precorrin-2 dehydrogenase / sirohydrochlorin ferrochelatase